MQTSSTSQSSAAAKRCTPKQVREFLDRQMGCTIGHVEQLAGVNIQDAAERRALWWQFQEFFAQPGVDVWNLVQAECCKRIARAVNAGQLSLVNPYRLPIQMSAQVPA